MPRVSRRSKLRSAGYTEQHVYQLLNGYDMFGDAFGNDDGCDVEAMKTAWELMRERLLADWIRSRPGSRPAAWWLFESRGRRERTDGIQHPYDDRMRRKRFEAMPANYWARRHANDLWFGLPRLVNTRDEMSAQYESEAAYLLRHDLLTPAEKAELFS